MRVHIYMLPSCWAALLLLTSFAIFAVGDIVHMNVCVCRYVEHIGVHVHAHVLGPDMNGK